MHEHTPPPAHIHNHTHNQTHIHTHTHTHIHTHTRKHTHTQHTQGVEYFKSEAARLERMISSGGVAGAKLDEMSRKASVLGAFNGEPAGGGGGGDDDVDEE